MFNYEKLKDFIRDLCEVTNTEDITTLLSDLFESDVKLHIFYQRNTDSKEFMQFQKEIINEFESALSILDNKSITNGEKLIAPVFSYGQIAGAVELNGYNAGDEETLSLITPIIAVKINNIELSGEINQSLNYNRAMKNIAKIIESQYELSYIVPLIGEIMDTYLENHLVYIYLKQNNKMKLVWPSTCLDETIHHKLSKLTTAKEPSFNKSKKIGYFPLVSENTSIGCLVTKSVNKDLSSIEIYQIQQLTKQIAITINRAKVYAEILKYATLDALTGFYNRHQLEDRIKQEVSHAKRKGTHLCAIMTDIDFFKKVNDSYGHAAGDLVLKTVAKIIRTQLREYDIAARYGGEEFIILLPFTNKKEACLVAERLRKAVKAKVINIEKVNSKTKTKNISITISLGVTEYNPKTENLKDFMLNVDKALYKAKETGRNRVVSV